MRLTMLSAPGVGLAAPQIGLGLQLAVIQDTAAEPFDEVDVGWPARIVAHETDHLAGRLYLDSALSRSLSSNENYLARWGGATPKAARGTRVLNGAVGTAFATA